MRLTFFVVWKSWASNPLRTALSVLGVGLGIAIVVAIHVMDHNTILSQIRLQRPNQGQVDFELRDRFIPGEAEKALQAVVATREKLAAREDTAAVGVVHQCVVAVEVGGQQTPVHLYGLSPLPASAFAHYWVAEGEDLSDLDGEAAVLIGKAGAERLGLRAGSTLKLSQLRAGPRTLCKQGVRVRVENGNAVPPPAVEVKVKGVLASRLLGDRHDGAVIVASYALAQRLAPGHRPAFQINRVDGVDVDRMRQDLVDEGYEVLDARSAMIGERADERAFRNGVKILGCLALVMGMFVIFETLSQSLVERLRQIGLLRCLGTTRGTVAGVFLVDAVATALTGAVFGVAVGIGLAWLMSTSGLSTLGRGKEIVTFELPWGPIAWTAVLGVLFTLLGAGFPLWKARNLPALQVLNARGMRPGGRGGEVYLLRGVNLFLFLMLVVVLPGAYLAMTPLLSEGEEETLAVLSQLGGIVLVFGAVLLIAPRSVQLLGAAVLWLLRPWLRFPAFLVEKSLAHSPGRFAASVCGLSVVLVAMVALSSITASLRADARSFGEVATQERLFFKTKRPVSRVDAEKLLDVEGVVGLELLEGTRNARFPLRGVDVARLAAAGGPFAGHPELADRYVGGRALVMSRRLARQQGKVVGDTVALDTDEGPVTFEVLAVDDGVGFFPDERAWAVTAPKWMEHDFCAGLAGVDRLVVDRAPSANPWTVMEEARRVLELPWCKLGEEITQYDLRDITWDFVLFDVLLGLILVLAAVGLVNAMTIAAVSRSREIGVLRALGVSRAQLRATFMVEGAIVAALASVLAAGLSIPLGMVVIGGLNTVAGLDAPYVVPWDRMALVPVFAVATGVVAAILPGIRALKESPAEAVRYE